MPVAIDILLPGITSAQYAQMVDHLAPALTAAQGFLAHASSPSSEGTRIVEIWRTEADWVRFVEEHVAPAAKAAGIVPVTKVEALDRLLTPAYAPASGERAANRSACVPVGKDEGKAFRLGPLNILVKEDGSQTRQTLAVAEFRGTKFRIPPHTHT
jgi:hypothetical protein